MPGNVKKWDSITLEKLSEQMSFENDVYKEIFINSHNSSNYLAYRNSSDLWPVLIISINKHFLYSNCFEIISNLKRCEESRWVSCGIPNSLLNDVVGLLKNCDVEAIMTHRFK